MNSAKRLEKIIQEKKWIKNDIGMGRMQLGKLIQNKESLILLIAPMMPPGPIFARVSKMLLVNNEFSVFYDGEYCEKLNISEFDKFRSFLTEDEWSVIYDEDMYNKLEAMNLISTNETFSMDVHENIFSYKTGIDEAETAVLNEYLICIN